jgi:hypothetical protein
MRVRYQAHVSLAAGPNEGLPLMAGARSFLSSRCFSSSCSVGLSDSAGRVAIGSGAPAVLFLDATTLADLLCASASGSSFLTAMAKIRASKNSPFARA